MTQRDANFFATQVVSAIYSGVPVWEITVANTTVMRRTADSYMNATQILKVAGLNKARRTRVLEREILQDPRHEKVQGGYGKYQGTWIPLDMATDLARKYKVHAALKPILEHDPTTTVPGRSQMLAPSFGPSASDLSSDNSSYHGGDNQSVSSWLDDEEEGAKRSRTASPSADPDSPRRGGLLDRRSKPNTPRSNLGVASIQAENGREASPRRVGRPRQPAKRPLPQYQYTDPDYIQPLTTPTTVIRREDIMKPADRQRQILMEIFKEETTQNIAQILDLLLDKQAMKRAQESGMGVPPNNSFMEVDMALDLEGHTALHWATALGRVRTVRALLRHRANPKQLNFSGQTALMRAVFVVNNFENGTFSEMLDLLSDVVFYCDNSGKTLLHHICITSGEAMSPQLQLASKNYMRTLLIWLDENGGRLPVYIDFQDKHGDSALMLAARYSNATLVEMLMSIGARIDIRNSANISALEYAAGNAAMLALLTEPHRSRTYLDIPDASDREGNMHSLNRYPPVLVTQSVPEPETEACFKDERAARIMETTKSLIRNLYDQATNQLKQREQKLELVQENVRDVNEKLAESRHRGNELVGLKDNIDLAAQKCVALEHELFSLLVDGNVSPTHTTDSKAPVGDLPEVDPTQKEIDVNDPVQVRHEVERLRRLKVEYERRGHLARESFIKWEQEYTAQAVKYLRVITTCTDLDPNDVDERTLRALMNELKAD